MKRYLLAIFAVLFFSVMASADCVDPEIVQGGAPWLKEDQEKIPEIQAGCKSHFSPQSCAVKVMKVEEAMYRVLCSTPDKK